MCLMTVWIALNSEHSTHTHTQKKIEKNFQPWAHSDLTNTGSITNSRLITMHQQQETLASGPFTYNKHTFLPFKYYNYYCKYECMQCNQTIWVCVDYLWTGLQTYSALYSIYILNFIIASPWQRVIHSTRNALCPNTEPFDLSHMP